MRVANKNYGIFGNLIILYFVLKPFYLWGESGGVQPGDLVGVLLVVAAFFLGKPVSKEGFQKSKWPIVLSLMFLGYVFIINGVWSMILATSSLMLTSIFYIFNTLIFVSIILISVKMKDGVYKYLYRGIIISVAIQVTMLLVNGVSSVRATNFFNNPNQLGYYALLCLSILVVVERKVKYNPFIFFSTLLGCFFLILFSVSKAALVSSVLMYLIFAFCSKNKGMFKVLNVTAALVISVFFFAVATNQSYLYGITNKLDSILIRIHQDGHENGYLSGRGYDRIFNHENYLFFGAGEGEYQRFTSSINPLELHSTLGNVFFSYGIIGLLTFLTFIFSTFYKNKFSHFFPLIFVLVYGMTHNGVRNSMLWMLIAILIVAGGKFAVNEKDQMALGQISKKQMMLGRLN